MVLIRRRPLARDGRREGFRPLAGIMVLIEAPKMLMTGYDDDVSVPLRGLWFLSIQGKETKGRRHAVVSVPLRGLWFLSQKKPTSVDDYYQLVFPSPCGDYGSYLALEPFPFQRPVRWRFRPLAGIMVLIPLFPLRN